MRPVSISCRATRRRSLTAGQRTSRHTRVSAAELGEIFASLQRRVVRDQHLQSSSTSRLTDAIGGLDHMGVGCPAHKQRRHGIVGQSLCDEGVSEHRCEPVSYVEWGPNTPEDTQAFLREASASAGISPRRRYAFAVVHSDAERLIGSIELRVVSFEHRRGEATGETDSCSASSPDR